MIFVSMELTIGPECLTALFYPVYAAKKDIICL